MTPVPQAMVVPVTLIPLPMVVPTNLTTPGVVEAPVWPPASPTQILLLRLTKWFQAQWGTHHPSAPGSNDSDSNGTNISRAAKSPEAQAGTTGGTCDTSGKGSEGCKVPILPEAAQQEKPKTCAIASSTKNQKTSN